MTKFYEDLEEAVAAAIEYAEDEVENISAVCREDLDGDRSWAVALGDASFMTHLGDVKISDGAAEIAKQIKSDYEDGWVMVPKGDRITDWRLDSGDFIQKCDLEDHMQHEEYREMIAEEERE